LYFDLEYPLSRISIDAEVQFIDTPRESFCFSTAAFQFRYLLLDDVIGDPISLVAGVNGRYTTDKSLHDISVPYHGPFAIEGALSLGKEFNRKEYWVFRCWFFGGAGIANVGAPWVRGVFALEGNVQETMKLGVYLLGYHGYGLHTVVDIDHFNGYGSIRDKSIDLAIRFGRTFSVYGTFSFEYAHRFYAKRCPENVNAFSISYFLPFSF